MRQYTDDELSLRQMTHGANPYHAPEGYFDALPDKLMRRLKARQRRRWAIRWAVAAVMAGCMATAGLTLLTRGVQDEQRTELAHTQYIDDALDYSMIDNVEIAYYLTEAE